MYVQQDIHIKTKYIHFYILLCCKWGPRIKYCSETCGDVPLFNIKLFLKKFAPSLYLCIEKLFISVGCLWGHKSGSTTLESQKTKMSILGETGIFFLYWSFIGNRERKSFHQYLYESKPSSDLWSSSFKDPGKVWFIII